MHRKETSLLLPSCTEDIHQDHPQYVRSMLIMLYTLAMAISTTSSRNILWQFSNFFGLLDLGNGMDSKETEVKQCTGGKTALYYLRLFSSCTVQEHVHVMSNNVARLDIQ